MPSTIFPDFELTHLRKELTFSSRFGSGSMAYAEVILTENIPNLGAEADLVKVRRGFARNFLIPQRQGARGHAEFASQESII